MIKSQNIVEHMTRVELRFDSREQFDEEFKGIIKSLLTNDSLDISLVDIFSNLFTACVVCGKVEEYIEICKSAENINTDELKEYLKENEND